MLLLRQIEGKEEMKNKREDNSTERKELKDINRAESIRIVKGRGIIGGKRKEEIKKLESLG